MGRITGLVVIGAILGVSAGCSRIDSKNIVSHVDYIPADGITSMIASLKQDRLSICLSGSISGDEKAWQEKINSIVLKWIAPLRELTNVPLAEKIEAPVSDQKCDGYVIVTPGQWAMTQMGQRPTVNVDASGYFASYNVVLHEFGHAFGLYDTYQGGQSGNCQAGQPQAVMCNTSFNELQTDDIKGVQYLFKQEFPSDTPGTVVRPVRIFAAIEPIPAGIAPAAYKLYFSAQNAAAPLTGKLSYCLGRKAECGTSEKFTDAIPPTGSNPSGTLTSNSAVSMSTTEVPINEQQAVTIRYLGGEGEFFQVISFKKHT